MREQKIYCIFSIITIMSFYTLVANVSVPLTSGNSGGGSTYSLELKADPSTIDAGETSIITITLVNQSYVPVRAVSNVRVNISTNLGYLPDHVIIPAGAKSSVVNFTSTVDGLAVIDVKSIGLKGNSTTIAVIPSAEPSLAMTPTVTATKEIPGFKITFAIAIILMLISLRRQI